MKFNAGKIRVTIDDVNTDMAVTDITIVNVSSVSLHGTIQLDRDGRTVGFFAINRFEDGHRIVVDTN